MRRTQVFAACAPAPIHNRKSRTSILDTHRMRSVGEHHTADGGGRKENNESVPVLNWMAPATIPANLPYTYSVNFCNLNGTSQEFWSFYGSGNSNGIPSTQTNVLFNVDGSASPSSSLT